MAERLGFISLSHLESGVVNLLRMTQATSYRMLTGVRTLLLSRLSMFQAPLASSRSWLLLPAQVIFWGQVVVVVAGTGWCMALASTLCFGGWYAQTHPTTGNDWVMRRLARLLQFLTFGLTEAPFPEPSGEDTSS